MKSLKKIILEKLRLTNYESNPSIINNAEDIVNGIKDHFNNIEHDYDINIIDKKQKILKWKHSLFSSTTYYINTFYYIDFLKNGKITNRIRIGLNDNNGGYLLQLLRARYSSTSQQNIFHECILLGMNEDSELLKGMKFSEWLDKIKFNSINGKRGGDPTLITFFKLDN